MGDGDWNYHGTPLANGIGYADNNRYLTSDYYASGAPLSGYDWSGSSYSFSSENYEWYHDLADPKGDANIERYQAMSGGTIPCVACGSTSIRVG